MDVKRPEFKETGEKNEDGTPKYETLDKIERETVNSMVPVSYTHLDVYKRQRPRRPGHR